MKSFKSGTYINQGLYKRFQPNPINQQWTIDNMEVFQLLSLADREPTHPRGNKVFKKIAR